jgi:5-(carboxyamino)imidazole ribonucleotide synthase
MNKKIGIIGGGQLGKMMILEAKRLGLYVVTLDPSPHCPSHSISDEHIVADFHDKEAIRELASKVDVITYEFEHINTEALLKLEKEGYLIYPSVSSLALIQDKFLQKNKLQLHGISVPNFKEIANIEELRAYAEENGYPIMLKARKNGYDGKGNYVINDEDDIEEGFTALKGDLMVEEFIDFYEEISVIATRGIDGKKVVYPMATNVHKDSILDVTLVCERMHESLREMACGVAERVMDIFEGVGTFCVEMFVLEGNKICINEVAPRPHNSGHYTIEGCRVNQFENHIRAIIGLPLGDTSLLHGAVKMRNLLGVSDGVAKVEGLIEAYGISGVNVHVYGKSESKTGRKMGHYTVTGKSMDEVHEKDRIVKGLVKICGE